MSKWEMKRAKKENGETYGLGVRDEPSPAQ